MGTKGKGVIKYFDMLGQTKARSSTEYLPFTFSYTYYGSMPFAVRNFLLVTLLVFGSGCGPIKEGNTARIHDSWNARFRYDIENRRLVSTHGERMRGRTWGRDELGRVDYDRYWSGRPLPSQDLLGEHHRRMDLKREERWRVAERERLDRRSEEMEAEATGAKEEDGSGEEGEGADENDDDFVPAPFLPQGIDDGGSQPDNPFPLPEAPSLPTLEPGVPPEPGLEEPPSPFDPLPPL